MPILNENRIYSLQSRERSPVLNPVRVPDAAGAMMGANAPVLAARLADSRQRAADKQSRKAAPWQAIGRLVGVGADVAKAYAGALERRDNADLEAMQAAYLGHMDDGAEAAYATAYERGDGPLAAIERLDKEFDGRRDATKVSGQVRERFDKWRAKARRSYVQKGARIQEDKADAYRKNVLTLKGAAIDRRVSSLLDEEDLVEWTEETEKAAEWKAGITFRAMGAGDFDETGDAFSLWDEGKRADFEGLKASILADYQMQRAKHLCAIAAADTSPEGRPDILANLRDLCVDDDALGRAREAVAKRDELETKRSKGELTGQQFLDEVSKLDDTGFLALSAPRLSDEQRRELSAMIDSAEAAQKRRAAAQATLDMDEAMSLAEKSGKSLASPEEETRLAELLSSLPDRERGKIRARQDGARQESVNDNLATLVYGIDPITREKIDATRRDETLAALRERAWRVEDATARTKLLRSLDEATTHFAVADWMDDYMKDDTGADIFASENNEWFTRALDGARYIEDAAARQQVTEMLLTGRAKTQEQETRRAAEIAKQRGLEEKEAQKAVKEEVLSHIYLGWAYDSSGEQTTISPAEKARMFRSIYPLLSASERKSVSELIYNAAKADVSVTPADIDAIGRAANVANLSEVFDFSGATVTVRKSEIDDDGTVYIDPSGSGNSFQMPVDALTEMIQAILEYKTVVQLATDKAGLTRYKPEDVLSRILANKQAFSAYCEQAQRNASADMIRAYRTARTEAFMPENDAATEE